MRRHPRKWWKSHTRPIVHPEQYPNQTQTPLQPRLDENEKMLRQICSNCEDVVFRPFFIGGSAKALLVYTEGLADLNEMDANVLAPLMKKSTTRIKGIQSLVDERISIAKREVLYSMEDCVNSLLNGNPVLFLDHDAAAVSLGIAKWEKRQIEEPVAEGTVRGPREGFTESLTVNTSLIRRIIKTPKLKMESFLLGGYTKTAVMVIYVEGLADPTLIDEAKARLSRIEIDGVLESAYLEEFMEDNPASPFPQILSTERPDVVCSSLLEGRVGILTDGTPFALVAPTTLLSLLQSSEDYYQRSMASTAIRWLRYLFVFFSFMLPSLYIALLTFHQEMVPTSLLISMATSREAVPFPAMVEALLMEVTFEALREAGVRLPKQVGAAVSIVGALVIGQAAVQAGIVSAPMVIVVAITGIASFMIPRYVAGIAMRFIRFPMMILAGSLGLLGIMLGVIVLIVHLCSLRSFGLPFLSPIAPLQARDLKDSVVRMPWWMLKTRPRLTGDANLIRQSPGQKPDPSKGGEEP